MADEEVDRLLLALDYERWRAPVTAQHYIALAVLLSLETAMRQGEILGIAPADVNLEARVVRLPRTKNGSERLVPLSKAADAVLKVTPEFPVSAPTFDVLFRRARKRAELVDLHFHDIRREATTRLAKKVPVEMLAKITGHRDINLLHRVYSAPDMKDVADQLD